MKEKLLKVWKKLKTWQKILVILFLISSVLKLIPESESKKQERIQKELIESKRQEEIKVQRQLEKEEKEKKELEEKRKKEEKQLKIKQKNDERDKILSRIPFIENDGLVRGAKDYIKENVEDPESLVITGHSALMELSNGYFSQKIKFNYKNVNGSRIAKEEVLIITGNRANSIVVKMIPFEAYGEFLENENLSLVQFWKQ